MTRFERTRLLELLRTLDEAVRAERRKHEYGFSSGEEPLVDDAVAALHEFAMGPETKARKS